METGANTTKIEGNMRIEAAEKITNGKVLVISRWLKIFALTMCLFIQSLIFLKPAHASAPLAILKSSHNAIAYQDQHLGTYEEDYQTFKQTLVAANVRFDELGDIDVGEGASHLSGYKLIVVPLLIDLTHDVVQSLVDFEKGGGKILITDGGGTPQPSAQLLEQSAGVKFLNQITATEKKKIQWRKAPNTVAEEFPVGTVFSHVDTSDSGTTLAAWLNADGASSIPAIIRENSAAYIDWAPGMQGEITVNANLLALTLEDLVPGITQTSAVQISFADYQNIEQELDYLTKRTDEAMKTAKQADLSVPLKSIEANYGAALNDVKQFDEAYHARRYLEADEYLQKARQEFSLAFAQSMPVRMVEARSVWLDRGTIIATKDEKGMAKLFDRLKSVGINVVYFEANNAGFAMFDSAIAQKNPAITGWDPLARAIHEAHKRGMELHAWLWVFNVGNVKHNPIVGKDPDYPGPVLSAHKMDWALESANGSLLPPRQHEFWLDPANPEACHYAKSLIVEVLNKYPVDGIQLDYIRYPFNGKGVEMGFDWIGRTRLEHECGISLDQLNDEARQIWQAWKIQQVNNFVKDISETVRQMKPKVRISAAVYAMPHRLRINQIQQDWETWVANGWVDTLNPMTYVTSAKDLSTMAGYVRESTGDKALVYPGLSIRQLDTAGLIEQLDSARETGTLGTTMFAAAHLDDKKMNVLEVGPYRRQPILTPQSEPLRAAQLLIDNFAGLVNRYLSDPSKHILSDRSSTNDVLMQIDAIQKSLHHLSKKSTADEIEAVNKDVASLHETIKNWLRLEAFIQRGYRAQYITSYLGQVEAILSYAAHKEQIQ